MQNSKTIQVSFSIASIKSDEDKLIALLSDAGFDSFWQDEDVLHAFIGAEELKKLNTDSLLKENFGINSPEYSVSELEAKNWNEEWEKNFEPALVSGQIYVYAPFHPKDKSYPYSILIEPKMSFGTAHHGTTAGMLEFLLEEELKNKTVIDAGCGTGILAIFAYMKGASNIFAYDNDSWAVENANENFRRNINTDDIVMLGETELIKDKKCDVFLANIHKNVILMEIPEYSKTLDPGGLLFLSGFYQKDLPDIKKVCFENGLNFEKYKEKDGWIAAKFIKEGL